MNNAATLGDWLCMICGMSMLDDESANAHNCIPSTNVNQFRVEWVEDVELEQ